MTTPLHHRLLYEHPEARATYDEMRPRAELTTALVEARTQRGWSQRELAETADLSMSTVTRLEDGDPVRLETMLAACRALDLTVTVGDRTLAATDGP